MRNHPVPEGVSPARGYSHVVEVSGGKLVFVAGQIALDAEGNVTGKDDLAAQTHQVLKNVEAALAAAGATFADVIKLNTYVVNLRPDMLPTIREVRSQYLAGANPPASTLVGVTALAFEGLLIEIEAVAQVGG
jgi:enamine deaminase RidA (YjgF/YER057c/UK114 family)